MMRFSALMAILTVMASGGCRTSGQGAAKPVARSTAALAATLPYAPPITKPQVAEVRQTAFEQMPTPPPDTTGAEAIPRPQRADPTRQRAATLDLMEAIEMSLAQNPDLIALRRNEGVALGVLGVATTYPFNPYVQIQATPFQQRRIPGTGATYHYVLLMQTLQLAHQQRYRDQIGAASLNTVRWNIHQAELLNLAQTERLYFTALYLRGLRDLTRDNAQLNTELLSVLERQLAAGAIAAADVAIVRLDNRSTRHQARLAEQNYQTSLLDLRRQLNLPETANFEPDGDLTMYAFLPADPQRLAQTMGVGRPAPGAPGDEQVKQIASGRPDVLAAQSDLDTARANERLANASRTPDLQLGPYYQRTDAGTDFYGFRGQMDLLIINTGMPLLRQRQAEVAQRYTVWRQLQVRATLEAQAAIDRYERAREMSGALGDVSDRQLPIELQRLEQQFREGEVDILRLFTARTSLIQNRRAQLDSLNEVAQAAAQVTATTAAPPQSLVVLRGRQPAAAPPARPF
jgi:outer membrane protein, heavy metal efflux system